MRDTRLGPRPAPPHWNCLACDHLFAATDDPRKKGCPRCGADRLVEVKQAIEEMMQKAQDWILSMAVPGEPYGRFRYAAQALHPWLLSASASAWRLLRHLGAWEARLSEMQRQQWILYWLSLWNPQEGMFVDPILTAADFQRGMKESRWWSNTTLIPELRALGYQELTIPPERMHDPVPEVEALRRHLESLDWESDPYSAGSQARVIVQHQRARQAAGKTADDEVVAFGREWLNRHQRPDTGMWGGKDTPNSGVTAGAYKIIRWVYMPNRWPVQYPEAILRYAISVQGEDGCFQVDDPCHNFDALFLIREMLPRVESPPAAAHLAAARSLRELRRHQKPDGGFSWYRNLAIGARPERGLLPEGANVSEMVGTQYWLVHAEYILDILEGRSETEGYCLPVEVTGSAGGG